MAIHTYMYDGVTYTFANLAEMFASFVHNGYVNGILNNLEVSAAGGIVSLASGFAIINGYWYKNPASKIMTIGVPDPTYPRIDRIVVRYDITAATITEAVLPGIPSAMHTP